MDEKERIRELEEELKNTPYNKATQHHIGMLKAKIAKLKEKAEKKEAGTAGGGIRFAVKKNGDATVVFVGPPSVGKSSLLNVLTNAESEVGAYEFTTLNVIPGMLVYNGAKIQLLDIPGIIRGAHAGKGRGREILSIVRSADLILVMGENISQIEDALLELYNAGIRLNKHKPDVQIKRKNTGGIIIRFARKPTKISEELVKDMLREYGYHNADVLIREDIDVDEFVDVLSEFNRRYTKGLKVITKADKLKKNDRVDIIKKLGEETLFISVKTGEGINDLKEAIYKGLGLIRVYTKKVGEAANLDEPLILMKSSSVSEACRKIHKDFLKKFKFARIWGKSVKFPGQRVGLTHRLAEGDILELHIDR